MENGLAGKLAGFDQYVGNQYVGKRDVAKTGRAGNQESPLRAPCPSRARDGSPVAIPLDWSELPSISSSARFSVGTVYYRL